MTQTSRSGVTEYPPTALSPHDLLRLRRLFGRMPYMHEIPARLDCKTVDDLINTLGDYREYVMEAATSARQTEAELYQLRSTLEGGAALLAMLQSMAKDSA